MIDQQALTGSANAPQHALDRQVNMFLFDLKNEATELGFKANESWHLELVDQEDIVKLKRHHTPVILLKLQPEALVKVYQQVKASLQQPFSSTDTELTAKNMIRSEKSHLAAYPARIAR